MCRTHVLVPAHNEAASIAETVDSLFAQTTVPDSVTVVVDNCSDDTADIAVRQGAGIFTTVGNTDKKAGALNQALASMLPELSENDLVLVVDADTRLDEGFIEVAKRAMVDGIGAVGGIFYGEDGFGLLGALQRNEYLRYSRQLSRTGKVWVLTGTASLFRVSVLRQVASSRGDLLPGARGQVYDTIALTEDNELTLAIKTLGWRCVSPKECRVVTEVMTTWGDLWRQRMRWQRGAIENLREYGWTPVTRGYWGQQLGMTAGVLAMFAFITYLSLTVHTWSIHPFWTSLTIIFVLERVTTVFRGGWKSRLVAAPLVIEILYDLFLQVVLIASHIKIALRKEAYWYHPQVN